MPEALNFFTFFCSILLILSVPKNSISILLYHLGSLDTPLLSDPITLTFGLALFQLMTRVLGAV